MTPPVALGNVYMNEEKDPQSQQHQSHKIGKDDIKAKVKSMMDSIPVSSNGTSLSSAMTNKFNPRTYMPDMNFSTPVIRERLQRSILHEFSEAEQKTRIELAAAYRLGSQMSWNENIYNHFTASVVDEETGKHCFLINPLGLLWSEITASSLLKIDLEGNIIHPGVVGDIYGVNKAGFVIHSTVHAARHDVKAVLHCHYAPCAGISATKAGFLELSQTAQVCGEVAYHAYEGLVVNMEEQQRIVRDLGDKKVMILNNHGPVTCGESVADAWYLMYSFMRACEIQRDACAAAMSADNLLIPLEDTVAKTMEAALNFSGSARGVKEFCAYMRLLDKEDDSYRN